MHCTYSELPKDLAFLGAFYIREARYWKDLANTQDLMEYYKYNALDTWNTANVWMQQIIQLPSYAHTNYLREFPLVFPCHLSELTGIKRSLPELEIARKETDATISTKGNSLDKMLGVTGFNTNSPVQVKALLTILGCKDIAAESGDEKHLKKAILRHPLNSRILNLVLDIRGERKLASTYLTTGEKAKELNGRILYSLNPHGTDTSRLASREHHFWCGLQIQNIPRGKSVKRTIIADEGFRFAECDLEQAESRDTAYVAGDETLINAVSGSRDFHSVNASAFFGVSYESIYSDETHHTLDKVLRDLAKRVNHGANYLMGAAVLVETMGEDKVWEAAKLLKLPKGYGLIQIAEFLLSKFHATYPFLSGVFYPAVVHEVVTTSKLQHHLVGEEGWTRYCFGHPDKNKSDKNAYVAHVPQSLNAQTLNKAYLRVFYEIALHPVHSKNFKLCAQIHDSILFQFRVGHEYLMEMVRERMEIPVTVKGYEGKVRTFTVPAAMKAGKDGLGSLSWADTE
jgi:DNA polymerase I-like protein with 3'-5' exonuclease and polymerase domains